MSEPVGPQYGLTPMQQQVDEVPTVYDSADFLTPSHRYNEAGASEFGGVEGMVQPPPHVPTAKERLMQVHHIDPADPGTGPAGSNSVAAPELEGDFS